VVVCCAVGACGNDTTTNIAQDAPTTTNSPATTGLTTTTVTTSTLPPVEVTPSPDEIRAMTVSGSPPRTPTIDHGGKYWAVYLVAASSVPDANVIAAVKDLRDRFYEEKGIFVGFGGLGCDIGGDEVLTLYPKDQYTDVITTGYPKDTYVAAVYYEREEDARSFADALSRPPLAIGMVQTLCAD
jgi:hypothetical protein